eukprot:jgi/Bigna1/69301/fgenesh1_pg.8_\
MNSVLEGVVVVVVVYLSISLMMMSRVGHHDSRTIIRSGSTSRTLKYGGADARVRESPRLSVALLSELITKGRNDNSGTGEGINEYNYQTGGCVNSRTHTRATSARNASAEGGARRLGRNKNGKKKKRKKKKKLSRKNTNNDPSGHSLAKPISLEKILRQVRERMWRNGTISGNEHLKIKGEVWESGRKTEEFIAMLSSNGSYSKVGNFTQIPYRVEYDGEDAWATTVGTAIHDSLPPSPHYPLNAVSKKRLFPDGHDPTLLQLYALTGAWTFPRVFSGVLDVEHVKDAGTREEDIIADTEGRVHRCHVVQMCVRGRAKTARLYIDKVSGTPLCCVSDDPSPEVAATTHWYFEWSSVSSNSNDNMKIACVPFITKSTKGSTVVIRSCEIIMAIDTEEKDRLLTSRGIDGAVKVMSSLSLSYKDSTRSPFSHPSHRSSSQLMENNTVPPLRARMMSDGRLAVSATINNKMKVNNLVLDTACSEAMMLFHSDQLPSFSSPPHSSFSDSIPIQRGLRSLGSTNVTIGQGATAQVCAKEYLVDKVQIGSITLDSPVISVFNGLRRVDGNENDGRAARGMNGHHHHHKRRQKLYPSGVCGFPIFQAAVVQMSVLCDDNDAHDSSKEHEKGVDEEDDKEDMGEEGNNSNKIVRFLHPEEELTLGQSGRRRKDTIQAVVSNNSVTWIPLYIEDKVPYIEVSFHHNAVEDNAAMQKKKKKTTKRFMILDTGLNVDLFLPPSSVPLLSLENSYSAAISRIKSQAAMGRSQAASTTKWIGFDSGAGRCPSIPLAANISIGPLFLGNKTVYVGLGAGPKNDDKDRRQQQQQQQQQPQTFRGAVGFVGIKMFAGKTILIDYSRMCGIMYN